MFSKVTIEQEVTPSHLPACLLDPLPACFSLFLPTLSPQRHQGWNPQGLRGRKPCSLYLLLSRRGARKFREGRALSPGKALGGGG